ncbi:DgyrCDS5150 [Dimorphilus gyrociliatus]|uniref:DgyrCDS5150 n=1 Tax=Dimorphilus gyrociliatus TaxID=2664684 RepID=A0A7I8VJL5_9ANNE|nr:DgyrCDS5150 [Dimorphilus gyrociliatus]
MQSSCLEALCDVNSPPSRAVLLLLKCNNIPVQMLEIKRTPKLEREYSSEIPDTMPYPAIIDHEKRLHLTGSSAILRYLCARFELADHWYPRDIVARAKVDEYIAWHDANTKVAAASVYKLRIVQPKRMHIPVNEEELRRARSRLDHVLHQLVVTFLKDKDFLCSNEITIADVLAICELAQAVASGFAIGDGRPRLLAWIERVKGQLPDFEKVHGSMEVKKPFRWLSMDSAM